ncbi:FecR family protein [Arcticibacter tournemirensis]|uniref:FecR family protein n=1 Tax=Arcticibacter tournemirensis TaxID=699437 RepID=A0A5M9HMU4_9SPHI|nr:FecR domain-containing protein [Arcticibacter tournemirensis]KAA8486688.1 FecR family protein [Arcticibacter tournemirensis]TQM49225.1 FecR family protein [Arcticibacter tournemirensis]
MPDKDISHLIHDESFLNYCFSRNVDDIRHWEEWLVENPEHRNEVEDLKSLVILLAHESKITESEEQFSLLKQRISSAGGRTDAKSFRLRSLFVKLSLAASFLLICAAGIAIYQSRRTSTTLKVSQHSKTEIGPGGNKAFLTLANGRKISLTDAANGAIAQQAGIVITKAGDGRLIYSVADAEPSLKEVAYNTIETPRGGQYEVRLPDGSTAWLNAASSLKYPLNFEGAGERRVELKGEGYFEVAKDKDRPFIVKTGYQEVIVLGTHFNIKAYSDEQNTSTTLLEGSVMVSETGSGRSKLLRPGQQSDIFSNNSEIHVSNVNPSEVIAWKSGYFIFDNQDIASIMRVISRWYDVDVAYNGYNKEERFGGTFSRSANLSEILENLESLGKIDLKIKGRRVIISNKY